MLCWRAYLWRLSFWCTRIPCATNLSLISMSSHKRGDTDKEFFKRSKQELFVLPSVGPHMSKGRTHGGWVGFCGLRSHCVGRKRVCKRLAAFKTLHESCLTSPSMLMCTSMAHVGLALMSLCYSESKQPLVHRRHKRCDWINSDYGKNYHKIGACFFDNVHYTVVSWHALTGNVQIISSGHEKHLWQNIRKRSAAGSLEYDGNHHSKECSSKGVHQ